MTLSLILLYETGTTILVKILVKEPILAVANFIECHFGFIALDTLIIFGSFTHLAIYKTFPASELINNILAQYTCLIIRYAFQCFRFSILSLAIADWELIAEVIARHAIEFFIDTGLTSLTAYWTLNGNKVLIIAWRTITIWSVDSISLASQAVL